MSTTKSPWQTTPEALCLTSAAIARLQALPVVVTSTTNGQDVITRKMSRITIKGKDHLADRVTGALFNPQTGQCLTSLFLRLAPPAKPTRTAR